MKDAYPVAEVAERFAKLGDVRPATEFPRDATDLTTQEMMTIVDTALALLSRFYVHLPLKQAAYGANPVAKLTILRNVLDDVAAGLESVQEGAPELAEDEFHERMTAIFNELRDRHTQYILPGRYGRSIAFLPFLVERCADAGATKYVVSKTSGEFADPAFGAAHHSPVEVTHWNWVPIERAIALNAHRSAGANAAARDARALDRLTFRWLGYGIRPDEDWVVVTYRVPGDDEPRDLRFPWAIVERSDDEAARINDRGTTSALAADGEGEWIRHMKTALFAPAAKPDEIRLDDVLAYRRLRHGRGRREFGYLRIFSFAVSDAEADAFVARVAEILRAAPSGGLIVDLRGNAGGNMVVAERLLQLVSPVRVEPEGLQFINTPSTLAWANSFYGGTAPQLLPVFGRLEREARATSAPYVKSLPLARLGAYDDIGQVYQGPVAVLVDALTYSAAEIFAAGVQDHGLGLVLGTSSQTGGGGANKWLYANLQHVSEDAELLPDLPKQASFDLALRRTTRVRGRSGDILEDLGVVVGPGDRLEVEPDDLLRGNSNLLKKVMDRLSELPQYGISARYHGTRRVFTVEADGLERVDVYVDGRPVGSLGGEERELELSAEASTPETARFFGFAQAAAGEEGAAPVVSLRWSAA